MTGYANRQSGEAEILVVVGSTPTLVTENDPVVYRIRRLDDTQETDVRLHPGSLDGL